VIEMEEYPDVLEAIESWLNNYISRPFDSDSLTINYDLTIHPYSLALCYTTEEDGIIDFGLRFDDGNIIFEMTYCVENCNGDCDLYGCVANNSLFAL